ncbi:leucine-rich repeat protein [Ruminococcus callidus]|uniref:Dockerin type I repeat-containing domain protein n=3 Tax=Ruminococcus callidus TaxID=40519 RepID=U2KYV1_9FIRM|nr:leucine-rich repeat protein [Ruminococcus callidus]ERJ97472.1 dockerin type I repeat-containing domain protein [Ruminococcus callidus ATCC 27760]MBS6597361.1 leucine-rich repeat protein [Ruminococcus callidus]
MKNCKFRRKHCKFRRLLAQVLFLWYHKYNFNEEEVFMKKKVLSLLTAAMMSGTCFFVGAEQICAAEYPSFTLRLNQHTGNAEFMEDETDKKVVFTATCLKYSGSDVELVDAKTNEVVAKMLDDGNFDVSGDDLENDRTWSAVLSFENAAVGSYSYYARLTDADGTVSTTKTFSVVIYDAVSDADAERMAEIAQKVGALSSDTTFQNADQETRKQMADALFDQLIAEGYVKENSVNYDAEKHWYAYQCEGVGGFSDVTCYLDIAVKDPDQVSTGIATATSAFTYVNHGDSIEITGFDNSISDVVIPSEIEGLPVTAISVGAFYLSAITSIEIPNTVTSIGEMAFLGCTSLKSVKLSTGVAKIDKNAFGSCSALQEIQVAKDNPNFSSLNGVLYSKKQDTLIIYPAAKTDAAYIIPSGVTSVAMYAFSENPYLETLTIPNSLIKVGDSAFYNCKNLRAVSYNGTEEEWNQITIGLLNEKLTGATIQYQERIIGDVNADGAFTISDVVLLQKWLLSVPDTQLADWKAADFNGDQTLNVFDLCQMRYNLLKQEEDSKR